MKKINKYYYYYKLNLNIKLKMNNYFIISLYLILNIIIKIYCFNYNNNNNNNIIILPFYRNISNIKNNNFINKIFFNYLLTNISIGSPPQIIPVIFSFRNYPLSIFSINLKNNNNLYLNYFNSNNSKTYSILKNESEFNQESFDKGIESKEKFIFQIYNKSTNIISLSSIEIKFILETERTLFNFKEGGGLIGLSITSDTKELNDYNFIKQLKKNDFIISYDFSFVFDNNNLFDLNSKGNFIIGDLPHNIYKEYKIKYIYKNFFVKIESNKQYFDIDFDDIIFDNISFKENNITRFGYLNGMIYGTSKFQNYIKKIFFEENIKNNICFENQTDYTYIYYYCKNIVKLNNEFKNKKIEFKLNSINYRFKLSNDELFLPFENYYYYMIYFNKNGNKDIWELGLPFFKKYLFTFNQDSKMIGVYIEKEKYNNNNNLHKKLIGIIIFILNIICFIFIYFFIKKIKKKKKLNFYDFDNKENEMEDYYNIKENLS